MWQCTETEALLAMQECQVGILYFLVIKREAAFYAYLASLSIYPSHLEMHQPTLCFTERDRSQAADAFE